MENTIFFILSQIQTALLGQISLDFIAKSVFFLIYAFFGLNFILQKFCPCKRNDKYQVCSRSVFNCKNHLVINDLTLLLILGQFRNLLVSWTIFTIILFALK